MDAIFPFFSENKTIAYTKDTTRPSKQVNTMNVRTLDNSDAGGRLEQAYKSEKPRLLARVRAAGRALRHWIDG